MREDIIMEDHYNTLGIGRSADREKIKKAYRERCKKFHPDISSGGENSFKNLQNAYEVLSNEDKKQAYDEELKKEKTRTEASSNPKPAARPFRPAPRFTPVFYGTSQYNLDLVLSPSEALRGGIFAVPVPVSLFERRTVYIRINGPVRNGSRFFYSLAEAGIAGCGLHVDIVIE